VARLETGAAVLDVGCGEGWFLREFVGERALAGVGVRLIAGAEVIDVADPTGEDGVFLVPEVPAGEALLLLAAPDGYLGTDFHVIVPNAAAASYSARCVWRGYGYFGLSDSTLSAPHASGQCQHA
jgi:hypothetical protein